MKTLLSIFTLFLFSTGLSQHTREEANAHFQNLHFMEAIDSYQQLLSKRKKPKPLFVERLAESYFNINDYHNARKWYDTLYTIKETRIDEKTLIKYVQSLKACEDYSTANRLLKIHYRHNSQKLESLLAQEAYLDSLMAEMPTYALSNSEINSPLSDFAPMYYKDRIIFSSNREDSAPKDKNYSWNNQPYLAILTAQRDSTTGALSNAQPFHDNIQSSYHEGTLSYSKDYKTIYYTQNYLKNNDLQLNPKGFSNMQIMKGELVQDSIVNAVSLKFNNPKYSFGHPFLTADGKRLYFVSNMFGGFGETDIYYVDIHDNGKIGSPINLGPTINTPGREMFPFVTDNNLYFASDAHFGLGGLDIFKSQIKTANDFGLPKNLGKPINSNRDDFSLIINEMENRGYLSSNRDNGKGDDDIYSFEGLATTLKYKGIVKDDSTHTPIYQVVVKAYNEENQLVAETTSNNEGYFEMSLPPDSNHTLAFFKLEYKQEIKKLNQADTPLLFKESDTISMTSFSNFVIEEDGVEKINVNPIFFNLNRYNITYKAAKELDRIVSFMKSFPNVKIKIEAHTDSRASDKFNLELSGNRARSTYNYLVQMGIAPERIASAIGYGESRLLNECSNGVPCSNAQHLANRRCDFIIIGK